MIRSLPDGPARVLRDGVLCYLASRHPSGPHLTPVVYALHSSRLWVTTSRSSVKARTWKRDRRVAGLVRVGERAVSFVGEVVAYDLLAPETWGRSVLHAPSLTRAATAFSLKNARFFAGYAVDAYRVPLAWTPPGRVFAEIRLDRLALIDRGAVRRTWGRFGGRLELAPSFRATARRHPFEGVPDDVRVRLGDRGDGVLAIDAGRPVAVRSRWIVVRGGLYAALPSEVLALAGGGPNVPASLTVDQASRWRARSMAGVLVQGEGRLHAIARLSSGSGSARSIAGEAGVDPEHAALVRIRPRRLVWWRGWDSGTVRP